MLDNLLKSLEASPIEHERDTDTDTSKSSSTSNSVQISLKIWLVLTSALHWDIVVDYHRYCRDIKTTCENVGSNQDLRSSIAEFLNNSITISPIKSSMNRADFVASPSQGFLKSIGSISLLMIIVSIVPRPGQYNKFITLTKMIEEPIVSIPYNLQI